MKKNYCVLVADGARARIYLLKRRANELDEELTSLVEVAALVNPEARTRDSENFSDSRPGLRQNGGGSRHGVDDGRAAHRSESTRRFAEDVVDAVLSTCTESESTTVLLAASPNMLGAIRGSGRRLAEVGELREIAKDLTKLSSVQVHDYLSSEALLPSRGRL